MKKTLEEIFKILRDFGSLAFGILIVVMSILIFIYGIFGEDYYYKSSIAFPILIILVGAFLAIGEYFLKQKKYCVNRKGRDKLTLKKLSLINPETYLGISSLILQFFGVVYLNKKGVYYNDVPLDILIMLTCMSIVFIGLNEIVFWIRLIKKKR